MYAQKLAAGDQAAIDMLRKISPVAWQHVNLFGAFEFSDAPSKVDIDVLAARYADRRSLEQSVQREEPGGAVGLILLFWGLGKNSHPALRGGLR